MPKTKFIKSLFPQERIDDIFVITQKLLGISKNGNQYLSLKLTDKTGDIEAKKWDTSDNEASSIREGDYFSIKGMVTEFNGSLQIRIDSLAKCSEALNPSDFMKSSQRSLDEMLEELDKFLKSIKETPASLLLDYFFSNKDFLNKFKYAPAAIAMHHGYISGLLEHTLEVAKTGDALAKIYPQVNRDILISGCLLHDMAKISEYSFNSNIEFTTEGHLVGHLVQGAMMVRDACAELELDELFSLHMQHMILSHHGKYEWGSPKRPKSLEAILLHEADNLSATVTQFKDAVDDSNDRNEDGIFTRKSKSFERRLFRGNPLGDISSEEIFNNKDDENDIIDEGLFDKEDFKEFLK